MFEIFDNKPWGDDYWFDEMATCDIVAEFKPQTIAVDDSEGWETVGKKPATTIHHAHALKWCKHGNACVWRNCPFRHEPCEHYQNWLKRGKRGHNCRHHAEDPECEKSPEEGGCKYDHRDLNNCETYYKSLPCSTEEEILDSFYSRKLDMHCESIYDISEMSSMNRSLLLRSLNAADIKFEEHETWLEILY